MCSFVTALGAHGIHDVRYLTFSVARRHFFKPDIAQVSDFCRMLNENAIKNAAGV